MKVNIVLRFHRILTHTNPSLDITGFNQNVLKGMRMKSKKLHQKQVDIIEIPIISLVLKIAFGHHFHHQELFLAFHRP